MSKPKIGGKPKIGDMVHYVSFGTPKGEFDSVCRAAVVAGVVDDGVAAPEWTVDLVVLNPLGTFFNRVREQDTYDDVKDAAGTFHRKEQCDS